MSKVKREAIWQHDKVLPYILNDLKQTIDAITPVQKIYLFGSRANTPLEDWDKLEGKDWDIVVQAGFSITNVQVWTTAKNYHIDLYVMGAQRTEEFLRDIGKTILLYPYNELENLMIKNKKDEYFFQRL